MKRTFVLLLSLAAVAGGMFLIPAASAGAAPLPAVEQVAVASGSPPEVVLTAVRTPTAQTYTVVSGDTLWAIGVRFLRSESAWSRIAAYNRIPNPNLIYVGDVVKIPPASYTGSASLPAAAPSPPPVTNYVAPKVTYTPPKPVVHSTSSYGAPGSFQACVATRESGNGSGSSNIYGILDSTWHSLGRSGSAWSASRAEQDAAFAQLYAMDGRSPWSPYDGC